MAPQIPISDAFVVNRRPVQLAPQPSREENPPARSTAISTQNNRPQSRDVTEERPADRLAFIAVVFKHDLPIIELELPTGLPPLPGRAANDRRFYSLGIGRSSFLELHQLADDEAQALSAQSAAVSERLVALKSAVQPLHNHEALRALEQELRILCHAKLRHHENIVKALFVGFDDQQTPRLGLELAQYGTLDDVLLSRSLDGDESNILAFDLALDVATGLAAMHACGIAHGDVKPGNVLVYKHPARRAIAKIADFSDSRFIQDLVGKDWSPLGGTHAWRAPECYYDKIYDPCKTDIYSFGLCCLALLARGDQDTPGSASDCFLDRLPGRTGSSARGSGTDLKTLSDKAVMLSANGWITRHTKDEKIRTLGLMISLVSLNRNPERRVDAATLITLMTGSVLHTSERSRAGAALDTLKGQTDQLMAWSRSKFEDAKSQGARKLARRDLFNVTDPRFSVLSPFFHRSVFHELETVTSELAGIQIPPIDEFFLDHHFGFQEFLDAFESSIQLPRPEGTIPSVFKRAVQASVQLGICYTNGWGDPGNHDMNATFSNLVNQLSIAARSGERMFVLLYLLAARYLQQPDNCYPNLPTRLWMAWGTLKGCQGVREALKSTDPRLCAKIVALGAIRHGPLQNREDPTAFVQGVLNDFTASEQDISELVTERGTTILQFAVYNSNLSLVRELVEQRNCNVDVSTMGRTDMDAAIGEGGETPIMLAARTRNLEIFNFLLEANADVRCVSKQGCNVLHSITWFPDSVAAELAPTLVALGASLTQMSREYLSRGIYNPLTHVHIQGTPLHWAATLNHRELVACLVRLHKERGETVPDFEAVVDCAALHFKADLLAILCDHSIDLHPLRRPASNETLDRLLALSVQFPMQLPIVAMHGDHVEDAQEAVVRTLLCLGARPMRRCGTNAPWSVGTEDIMNKTVIYGSLRAFKVMIQYLQHNGEDVGAILKDPALFKGRDAVQRSIYCNRQPIFDYLMTLVDENLADLTFVSDRGMTALHAAATQTGNAWYIHELLRRNCDPHARSKDGSPPFLNALKMGNLNGARLLAESPPCNKYRLFEEPSDQGYTSFGSVIAMALKNYRNRIGVDEIEFLDAIGATHFMNHIPTSSTVLHVLACQWPSSRPDYADFEAWLVDWLVARMPADLMNLHDEYGMAPLHWMAVRANDHAVSVMLQSDKTDPGILTLPSSHPLPCGMTILDVVIDRCTESLPAAVRDGGARELRFFQQRIERLMRLLLETEIAAPKYPGTAREELVKGALRVLGENIEQALVARRSESSATGIEITTAPWPQFIPSGGNSVQSPDELAQGLISIRVS